MATTRATEKGSQRAIAVSSEGNLVRSQQSKVTSARQAQRIARVCLRVFMLEGAFHYGGVEVAIFFVKLGTCLRKCLLIFGSLLFPVSLL